MKTSKKIEDEMNEKGICPLIQKNSQFERIVVGMYEIVPMQYSKSRTRLITYKGISKEIDKQKLLAIWKVANAKYLPEIIEDKYQVCFQYPNKPILILRRTDGRLCSLGKHTKWIRHQAGLILRILNEFALVEGFERRTVAKRESRVEWK